ncbi:DUF596 domain-containing protein [Laribacter hongkongensis]|uniref:DUF596 domain-containing protein n=1 Tax=Laribacter hongkongensis TaxID=168471 RepID=UPI001EFC5A31|nr:DUF596 domain-containing protein [Laribacter hongkongensis]MCG9060226.1 DUF596 domain-containing protein [Laribacter hongkongensis]MCG9087323.1 DUF596 domain-containing protein [Laribacter hongkongensis]
MSEGFSYIDASDVRRHVSLRLAKHGEFLSGDIDDQLNKLFSAFPENEDDMDIGGGEGVWFFTDGCPAGAVWIGVDIDGNEWFEWT